jgi:hypothetical protein
MRPYTRPHGERWTAFCTHPLYGVLHGGGCQVDVFLLLSGFLLALKYVDVKRGKAWRLTARHT